MTKGIRVSHSQSRPSANNVAASKTPDESHELVLKAIVGVGGSAGGLEAFITLLSALPVDTCFAFVFVLHLPPDSPSHIVDILSRATTMNVTRITNGLVPQPNHLYVAGSGFSAAVEAGRFKLVPVPHHTTHRQIDTLFKSLAENFGTRCIGVLLSGMDADGVAGLGAIKLAGGITFAQDGSAKYSKMPHAAVDAGCVDAVLSPIEIAHELAHLAHHPWLEPEARRVDPIEDLEPIIEILHAQCGVSFSDYRTSTLQRRIMRRMALAKYVNIQQYTAALCENEQEARALVQDILIGVTEFFRDSAAFAALAQRALPPLFYGRSPSEQRRVWVLGCSTGEEAYSIAMLIEEIASQADYHIFATDLNPAALEKARRGVYQKSIEKNVSPQQLRRFFEEVPDGFQVVKAVRQRCTFAPHNALHDPPFLNIDLLCCRNVMIYMGTSLQHRLAYTLYRSLRPQGILFLGSSENLGPDRGMFVVVDARQRIFSKKPNALLHRPALPLLSAAPSAIRLAGEPSQNNEDRPAKMLKEGERLLLNQYAPPGVFVDANYEILQYRGDTSPYLTPYSGRPSTNLLKMTREGMLVPLRACLLQAKRSASPVSTLPIKVHTDDTFREIIVRVIPVSDDSVRCYWVLFEPALSAQSAPATSSRRPRAALKGKTTGRIIEELRDRITQQSAEIRALRDETQEMQEHQQAAQEELRAANEEMLSANEELQSTNHELINAQQDIQSANEELKTLNGELKDRNTELDRLNSELGTLLSNLQLPVFVVWENLNIRHLTPPAMRLLGATQTDLNRPLGDFRSPLKEVNLAHLLSESIRSGRAQKERAVDVEDCPRIICVHPCYTPENHIDGGLAVLMDTHPFKYEP